MGRVSRRGFLGAAGAAGAVWVLPESVRRAVDTPRAPGRLADIEHVVVFMQENRSFDHYFGTLAGVRGFGDRYPLRLPGGRSVFAQPDGPGGSVSPFHLDSRRTSAQCVADLDHSWGGTHRAWNAGRYDGWVAAKGALTMGHYTRADVPLHYALADAFTVCDAYFCSVQGPTHPNRLYLWTGTIDPAGSGGGPATDNDTRDLTWTTYPERLEKAGIPWRVYQERDNFGDNALEYFARFTNAPKTSSLWVNGMARRPRDAFARDVAAGRLPAVSWVVAPAKYSEHPAYPPAYGADYLAHVLDALASHPEVWAKTVLFLNYDENDGFFDHVPPPTPPPGTPDEFVGGLPIGLGPRVPMLVVSPWSRGGYVCSQTFDHTSVLRFLELWTGVREPNISAWRRAVCGDLTSAFDFAAPTVSFPSLPDTAPLVAAAARQCATLPAPTPPANPTMPRQEPGTRRHRPLPYQPNASSRADCAQGQLLITMSNTGTEAVTFAVYANAHRPFEAWQYTVGPGGSVEDSFNAVRHGGGPYDLTLYGPNGFQRGYRGDVRSGCDSVRAAPEVVARTDPATATVRLTLTNTGGTAATVTVTANAFVSAEPRTYTVKPGATVRDDWPTSGGWYDLTATADTGDGFVRSFAGHIERGH